MNPGLPGSNPGGEDEALGDAARAGPLTSLSPRWSRRGTRTAGKPRCRIAADDLPGRFRLTFWEVQARNAISRHCCFSLSCACHVTKINKLSHLRPRDAVGSALRFPTRRGGGTRLVSRAGGTRRSQVPVAPQTSEVVSPSLPGQQQHRPVTGTRSLQMSQGHLPLGRDPAGPAAGGLGGAGCSVGTLRFVPSFTSGPFSDRAYALSARKQLFGSGPRLH